MLSRKIDVEKKAESLFKLGYKKNHWTKDFKCNNKSKFQNEFSSLILIAVNYEFSRNFSVRILININ